MVEIISDDQIKSKIIDLERGLVSIHLEDFGEDQKINLELAMSSDFKAVSLHLKEEDNIFFTPEYSSSYSDIKPKTFSLLIQNDSKFSVFLCQGREIYLSGSRKGLMLNVNDRKKEQEEGSSLLHIATGTNLYETIESALKASLKPEGSLRKLPDIMLNPLWLKSLGWQSTVFLKESLSHEKIINAVSFLIKSGCPIKFVLIDEGWQQLMSGVLKSFDADVTRFPHGLKQLIDELEDLGVDHVGVSHGMMGAKNGLHEDLAKKYGIDEDALGNYFLGENLGKSFEFFNDYYAYLKTQGVAFIKAGRPASPYHTDISKVYKNLQAALQASASVQFNSAHFNAFPSSNAEDTDFEYSFKLMTSIRNTLFNALWNQHFMLPDFGAWKTTDKHSEILAVLHALSGSVNVICDKNSYNHHVIKKICLPCGKILMVDRPLTLCRDSVFTDPVNEKKIYKAFTHKAEVHVLAAFNLKQEPCTLHGFISASDIEGVVKGRFALFSHHKGFIGCFDSYEKIEVTLKPNHADVFTFAPIKNGVAVLGCYNFYLLRGAITEVNIDEDSIHITAWIASPMIIYCEHDVLDVRRNGAVIAWEYDEKRKILCIDSRLNHLDEHSVYSISF